MVSEKVPRFAVVYRGTLLPKPLSGHPALDLCNTLAGWDDPPGHRREWLTTPALLATWADFAGLSGPRPDVDDTLLADLRDLREHAYRLLRDHGHERDHEAFLHVARYAEAANAHTVLARTDGGAARFALPAGHVPRRVLHAAALAVVDLLGRPERTTVRACPGDGCGWLFLDPRGRRTWCTMAVCGNRAKVRAYAARQRD